MKETMKWIQQAEKKWIIWKVLTFTALLWMLLWSPLEWSAQNWGGTQWGATVTEVTTPGKEIDIEKTKDWESVLQEMKDSKVDEITDTIPLPDTLWIWEPKWEDVQQVEATPDAETTPDTPEKEESKIRMWWMIQVWTGVAGDAAEVCSDKPEVTMVFDVYHKDSWLWLSLVRLEDFWLDKESPCSQATIIDPYFAKKFWPDGKLKLTFEGKYTVIDKKPELGWFAPDVKLAYSDKWWTIEGMYIHKFQKWKDSDAFRLSVSNMMSQAFELTLQWRYDSGYDKRFYGRVTSRVFLWSWVVIEISCIAKHGKLTPTFWVVCWF